MKNKYSIQFVNRMLLPIIVAVFSIFVSKATFGQAGNCAGGGCTMAGSSYGSAQTTTSSTFVSSLASTWGGEYNTYNVTSGNTYEWSLCSADGAVNPTGDMELTLKNTSNTILCYSDDVCGSSPKILWVATFTGQVRVLITAYGCLTNSNNHTVVWRQAAAASSGPVTCSNANAYGASAASYTGDEEIFNVTFGTLNSTSTCATTAPGANSANQKYSNYAGQLSAPVVNPGQSIPWSVNVGTCGGWYGVNLRIYIDYNIDGDFADANENPVNITAVNGVNSGTISIPAGATVGQARMRVIATEGTVPGPTGTYLWGETEDYCIQVAAAVNCSGIPNASTASISSTGGCPNASITLSSANFTFGTGISYQWQSSPNGVTSWSNIVGATSTNYTTSTASTLYYRLVTSCLYSASSNQSNVVSYTVAGNQCQCGGYPASAPYYNYYNDITNVTIAGINNSSTCTSVAPGPGSQLNLYSNYTGSVGSGNLQQGQVANFSLTSTGCLYGAGSNFFQIYIDYNQDGDFLDAGELCYYQPANAGGNQTLTGNFVVPPTASVGVTRMRIVNVNYGTPGTYNYATYTYYYGETEDYCITISIPPPCAGTPTPGNTIASPNSIFAGQTTVLSLQNSTSGTGITYQWQSASSATGTWTNITGATSYTYTATPTATTWYQCVVTCTNGPSSGTSTPVQVMYNPYCNPAYTYGTQYGDLISSVVIPTTTLNNNSGTGTSGPAYTYYSNIAAPTLQAATSYQLQVTAGSFSNQSFAAWIDYNDNFIFEASEKIGFSTSATTASFQMISFQINLACLPPLGVHRMRVRGVYATAGSSIDPCATYYYGETEDYNVNIVAGAPFSPSFTATPTTSACTLTDYTYTTQAGMMSYTWGIPGTAGVDYNIVSGGTSTSNTVTLQWLSGGSKTVSINYLNASGCSSTGAVSTTVTVQSTVAITPITGIQSVCAGSQVTFATPTAGGTWSSSNSAVATIASLSGVVAGSTPGTATMTYTVPNPGTWCPASTATRTITVLPTPVLTTSSNVNVCAGSTTTLSGTIGFNTTCSQTITLYDSYGDGWNGCTATVSVGGVQVLTNITLANGAGPLAFTFPSTNGQAIQVTFSAASWPYEPYFTITNGAGTNLVTNYYPYANGPWNGTASGCPSITPVWSPSTGLSATNVLNPVASPTTSQSYTMSATASNGCSATSAPIVVNVLPAPIATISALGSTSFCQGGNVALLSSPGVSYSWSNGSTSQNVNVSTGGPVTVQVTGTNGCSTTSAPQAITVHALPVLDPIAGASGVCVGSTGTITNTTSGGTWTSANANVAVVNALTGIVSGNSIGTANMTYSYTNANGCSASVSAPLVVAAIPNAATTLAGSTVFCQGGSVTISAPTASSYLWSPGGETTQSISATTAGSYSVQVSNGACSSTSPVTMVAVNALPAATIAATGTSICQGGSVTLTAAPATSYAWTNGSTTQSITVSTAGNYGVTVTNVNGCTSTSATTAISVGTLPASFISAAGPTTFCNGNSVVLSANSGASYQWSNGATTQNITANASGIYFVTITNASGCSAVSNEIIVSAQQTLGATATAVGPTSVCDGAYVTLVASPGTSYLWSNGATTQGINAGVNGNYNVTVTNALGCTSTSTNIPVTILPVPSAGITASGATTFCEGGSVVLTGTGGNTYIWNSNLNGSTFTATQAGIYVVTAYAANGCSDAAEVVVNVNEVPSGSLILDGNTVLCPGESLVISAQPNNTYAWSNTSTTQTITVTTPGTYSALITGLNGCTANSDVVTVTAGAATSSTINATANSSYVLNEVIYTQSGTYTQTLLNAAGCDSTITLNLTLTVGIEEGSITDVTLYPNPTSESFTIQTSTALHGTFSIVDAQGKLVFAGEMTGTETNVNISSVARGIYYLRIPEMSEPLRVVKN